MSKKKKSYQILLLIMLLCLSVIEAEVLYPGETYNYSSGLDEILVWEIINNDTFINATKIDNSTIQIVIPELAEDLNFSIIIKGYKDEEEKIVYVDRWHSSGGGGSTRYIYKNNTINNTIYLDKTKEVEVPIYLNDSSGNEEESLAIPLFYIILAFILFILSSVIVYKLLSKRDVGDIP